MDGDQKQNKSSALRSLTNDKSINNNKPDPPRRISSSPPQLRKRKPAKYTDDDDYNEIDEEHVVKSDSEDDFEAEQKSIKQKKKKQKKSQKKQVASTSTALVAPEKPTTRKAKRKAATQKKKELAKVYNDKMSKFYDKMKKDKKANGFTLPIPKLKQATVCIRLKHKPLSTAGVQLHLAEIATLLLSEVAWTQDRFRAIMVNYNELSESEKLPFLNRIQQNPALWDDYSSLTSATQKLFNKFNKSNSTQLNLPTEKEFQTMRNKEITSRGLVDQPEFNTDRKNSIIRQLVGTIIGDIDKNAKSKAKKQKATFKLQSTMERASEALANGRPQDVIMKSNVWEESASFLYM